jgi:hypothetical protein
MLNATPTVTIQAPLNEPPIVPADAEVLPPLDAAAIEIGRLYRVASRSYVEANLCAAEAGRRLKAKRDALKHGQWTTWLTANRSVLGFVEQTARRLIAWAERVEANRALTSGLNETTARDLNRELWGNSKSGGKRRAGTGDRPKDHNKPSQAPTLDSLAFAKAPIQDRRKFVSAVGRDALVTAMPPEWAEEAQSVNSEEVSKTGADSVQLASPEIPAFLRRDFAATSDVELSRQLATISADRLWRVMPAVWWDALEKKRTAGNTEPQQAPAKPSLAEAWTAASDEERGRFLSSISGHLRQDLSADTSASLAVTLTRVIQAAVFSNVDAERIAALSAIRSKLTTNHRTVFDLRVGLRSKRKSLPGNGVRREAEGAGTPPANSRNPQSMEFGHDDHSRLPRK